MSTDYRESVGAPSPVAETRELIAETRQAILDCCNSAIETPHERAAEDIGLLSGIADGLIVAFEYAKVDNDPATLALIEKAMLHVGQRLARAIGPREAGLARH